RTHTVVKGELISSIALRYGISSQQLLDANPGTNPNLLIAGTVLVIPVAAPTPAGFVPSPTPLAVQIGAVNCHPVSEGGAWCFALVTNQNDTAVENVSALLRLADSNGTALTPVHAYTPLNLVPARSSQPLAVYLPAPLPSGLQASLELLTALPVTLEDTRYLPATLENTIVQIVQGGLSAEASSEVLLGGGTETQAGQVWVAAVAYDIQGNVVGVRRWESPSPLSGGGRMPLVMRVYSVAGAIARVELFVEARR
ncbi:MAG TPA: LysM domain-containing protein, partial [Anaerolineaceae bacterium]|nr:LysM domain-containing protein [Anaerolineaceae bacterium]